MADGFDVRAAVLGISADFAAATGVEERHVTVTWQELGPHAYAAGGVTAAVQPASGHPVLVDLVAPDSHGGERLEACVEAAARVVAQRAGVDPDGVFVVARPASSGGVFDAGAIVRWD
jgi:hypothetical protein